MTKTMIILSLFSLTLGLAFVAGCESEAQTGALLGSGIGAGIGALAGGDSEAMLIGAAIGGGAGYMLGNEGDKKEAKAATDAEMASLRAQQNSVTIWITNSNNSKTSVTLRKSGPNYIGPNNEVYDHLPTEDDLRPLYGF